MPVAGRNGMGREPPWIGAAGGVGLGLPGLWRGGRAFMPAMIAAGCEVGMRIA